MYLKGADVMAKIRKQRVAVLIGIIIFAVIIILLCYYFNLFPQKEYKSSNFNIEQIKSSVDFNRNGVDDYTDIMLGARKDAENHPKYNGKYWENGYPPDDIGVCTDVIWRGFKNAGYNLREMLDKDIKNRPEAYTQIDYPDSNIDFRRVKNLKVFFDTYCENLTVDTEDIAQWQAGDIAVFDGDEHIGIVSDKRNSDGEPFIIHNMGQPQREEDYFKRSKPTSHYRFNAANIDEKVLVSWE